MMGFVLLQGEDREIFLSFSTCIDQEKTTHTQQEKPRSKLSLGAKSADTLISTPQIPEL